MPSGIPIRSASATATRVSASVSMLSCHRPCRPMNVNPPTASRATFQLPNVQDRKPSDGKTPSQPITAAAVAVRLRDERLHPGDEPVDERADLVEEAGEDRVGVLVLADPGVQVV